MRRLITWVFFGLTVCLILAGCGGGNRLVQEQPGQDRSPVVLGELPTLSGLPTAVSDPVRITSDTSYNLLNFMPYATSGGQSAVYDAGILTLDPAEVDGPAYAIFGLGEFPGDGSAVPYYLQLNTSAGFWIGVSDYSLDRWVWNTKGGPVQGGANLISGTHVSYFAVVAVDGPCSFYSLEVTMTGDLADPPVAGLLAVNGLYETHPTVFSAAGSDGGNGVITELTIDFDDGSAPYTYTDPTELVEHTYIKAQTYNPTLTVRTDKLRTDDVTIPVVIKPAVTDLLVVYNSSIPADLDLAQYYMSPATGRAINAGYMLGLPLGEEVGQTIARADYNTNIRDAVKTFLDANPGIKTTIKYILLMKGIPHQIPGENEFDNSEAGEPLHSRSTYSSVDSDLCLLYSDIPAMNWVWNDPVYTGFWGDGFYLADEAFQANTFEASWLNPDDFDDVRVYTINYLVGRLSAYTYDEAKALVDRSLAASAPGSDWIIFDSCEPRQDLDTMVDPVWPSPLGGTESGEDYLNTAGLSVFADVTTTRIISTSAELPAGFVNSVIGYGGWGVNHTGGSYAHGNEYILEDLSWNYKPGACFMSYESFNGTDLDDSDGIQRRGQGQIADFLRMGGTVAIGNTWEPFTVGVGDERWVFDRYLHHGDRWIEAAYKGLRLLSWQEIVVGDPLCRVAAD